MKIDNKKREKKEKKKKQHSVVERSVVSD